MNIWYVSKYASPSKYYFGTRHFYLGEEWVKLGHRVCVITSNSSHQTTNLPVFKGRYLEEDINGVQAIWLNTVKSRGSGSITRVLSWLHFDLQLLLFNKKSLPVPDVIIVSSLALTTVIPCWLLARKYKSKFIFEVRDIWPLSLMVLGGYSKNHPFIRMLSWIERYGYRKADLVVGTIPNLAAHIKNEISQPVKCVTIPQGVSIGFYSRNQEELPPEYVEKWLPGGYFYICYAGAINVNNPLDCLVEAAALLQNDQRIRFVILGEGSHKKRLMEKAAQLKNVSFPPAIKKSQVNFFLRHVHACYDSFESQLAVYGLSRNKWIDYMFAAKPIICSYDGFQSMVNEADCGDFIPFGNVPELAECITRYANMPQSVLAQKGENGKQFLLRERTFDKLARKYLHEIEAA